MNAEEFETYKMNRYRDQVEWYDRKSSWNKRWHQGCQVLIVLFSTLTTSLAMFLLAAGLCGGVGTAPLDVVLRGSLVFSGVVVMIVTALERIFRFQELWTSYRMTSESLKKEGYYHQAKAGEYKGSDDPTRLFVERVESLISKEHTAWTDRTGRKT